MGDDVFLTLEQKFVRAVYNGLLAVSPATDHYCTWLITLFGAASAVVVANLGSIAPHLSSTGLAWAVALFILAAISAALEKGVAIIVQAGLASVTGMMAELSDIASHHQPGPEGFNFKAVIQELMAPLWFPARWLAAFGARKGGDDMLWSYKYLLRWAQIQWLFASIEVICTLAALIVFLCSLTQAVPTH
jgi:hypothetical protein